MHLGIGGNNIILWAHIKRFYMQVKETLIWEVQFSSGAYGTGAINILLVLFEYEGVIRVSAEILPALLRNLKHILKDF